MRLTHHHFIWLPLVALVVVLAFPVSAQALTISPSRIETSGDPGQTIIKKVLLVNESDESETYYTSFANFEAQGESGTPVFVDPKDDLGTWMRVSGDSLTLKGGESREVVLTISIPTDATPGGHFAAIFWGTTPPSQTGAVSVGSRTGMLVLLSVSGEVQESMGLVDFGTRGGQWLFRTLPVGFQYRFSNQGGDRVKPIGTITVRSILGWRVAKIDANPVEGNVLPNTTRKFLPEWSKGTSVEEKLRNEELPYSFKRAVKDEWRNFAVGIFRAQLKTEFGTEDQRVSSKSVYFVVFPWELLLVLVPGIFVAFIILRFFLRRYNRSVIRKAHRYAEQGRPR